ncbi:CLUMA_CG020660, isoform A [Clunio marinus]|uniref:Calponin n=1 Tax=Clunio marinus TaxID=568069 RepID=A0A1J1J6U8_9DIPT|nr:CLUMA_CG020660, isoform A [Clunio marinus]
MCFPKITENEIAGKRDTQQEEEAQEWIEAITGEQFTKGSFEESLRDCVLLCRMMNKLAPGCIQKINTSGGDYKIMDNISQFQKAAVWYGVGDVDLFNANDLCEMKNIALVTQTIFAVARAAYKHPEFKGPYLGPRPSEENKRDFTEDQLRAGEAIIGLQAGTNKGASQAGTNMGASRKIILGK